MLVKAAPNIKFPREDKPRLYIEQEPVDVPESAYYHRAILDGDLVAVEAAPAPAVTQAAALTAPLPELDKVSPTAGV